MNAKFALEVGKETFKEFMEDKALRLSAALAYYAIFSIGPLLFVMVMVASWAFGDKAVQGQVHDTLNGFVGETAAKTIESMMAAKKLGSSPVTTALAIFTLLIGASGVFGQLQDALNTIWEVKAKPGMGLMSFLRDRFLSMSMVLGLGFLLLVSMVLTTAVQALVTKGGQLFPIPDVVTGILSEVISFIVVALLFAMIFKFLPDVKIPWKAAFIGAGFTAVLFTGGKFLLGLYLGREGTASAYGAAGSVVVVLLWIYYSSVILFLGAEFTQAYLFKTGKRMEPSKYAVPVTEEAKANEGMPRRDVPPGRTVPEPVFAKKLGSRSAGPLTGVPEFAGSPGLGGERVSGAGGSTPAQARRRNGNVAKLHPWASLFAAVGIGVVTGWRITRDLMHPARKV
jgi:membrane protein